MKSFLVESQEHRVHPLGVLDVLLSDDLADNFVSILEDFDESVDAFLGVERCTNGVEPFAVLVRAGNQFLGPQQHLLGCLVEQGGVATQLFQGLLGDIGVVLGLVGRRDGSSELAEVGITRLHRSNRIVSEGDVAIVTNFTEGFLGQCIDLRVERYRVESLAVSSERRLGGQVLAVEGKASDDKHANDNRCNSSHPGEAVATPLLVSFLKIHDSYSFPPRGFIARPRIYVKCVSAAAPWDREQQVYLLISK